MFYEFMFRRCSNICSKLERSTAFHLVTGLPYTKTRFYVGGIERTGRRRRLGERRGENRVECLQDLMLYSSVNGVSLYRAAHENGVGVPMK